MTGAIYRLQSIKAQDFLGKDMDNCVVAIRMIITFVNQIFL